MNINKFTQKSLEAVNNCEKYTYEYGNQEVTQEHFLYSLLKVEKNPLMHQMHRRRRT